MAVVDAYKHVFPVVGGNRSKDGEALLVSQVFGTAFPIGGDFWLTAAHVLRGASNEAVAGLGFVVNKEWLAVFVERHEMNESHDIAVFEAKQIEGSPLRWAAEELAMSTEVLSVGFPYALTPDLPSVSIRAFRGSITAAATTTKIPGRPRAYELQFQCPRGLSGAPLLHESRELCIVGVIVGNAATEMLVLSDKELIADGSTTIVERYEMLQLGIAVQVSSLLQLKFQLLGGTLQQHLHANKLA